ncbi:Sec-independent protein translocase protein TatAy [Peptococcaceae bacterium CEB3]|nr:Sec-independent protein translocase protein TatAy [Peptococcaceae bacterium CEB3]
MFSTFGFLSPMEIVIVLVIALIIFGPGKLPELGKSLGQGINEFKSATSGKGEDKGGNDKA